MNDGPTCDLSKPWEEPAPKQKYPDAFDTIMGQTTGPTLGYVGLVATGRVDGMQFIIMAPDRDALAALWSRIVEYSSELGQPVYRAAVIPAQRFEGPACEPGTKSPPREGGDSNG